MADASDVAAIVLHWRRTEETLGCLDALNHLIESPACILVVVTEDDGRAAARIGARHPDVDILSMTGNPGYAAGNNHAIERARASGARWLWLLNDDTRVAPDALTELLAQAGDPRIAALGPLVALRERPDEVMSAGGSIDGLGRPRLIGLGQPVAALGSEVTDVDFLSGCAILLCAEAVEAVGGIDEGYFLYYEEADWCRRARVAGYRVSIVPRARVTHPDPRVRDAERPHVTYYMARNRLRYLRRAGASPWTLLRVRAELARTLGSWILRPRWRGKGGHRDALWRALWDDARGRCGPAPRQWAT